MTDTDRLVEEAQRIAMEPALYYDSTGEPLGVIRLRSLQFILSALQQAQARPEIETPCVCTVDDGLVQEWVSKARADKEN